MSLHCQLFVSLDEGDDSNALWRAVSSQDFLRVEVALTDLQLVIQDFSLLGDTRLLRTCVDRAGIELLLLLQMVRHELYAVGRAFVDVHSSQFLLLD